MDYVWAVIYLIVVILAGAYMLRWPQRKKRAGVFGTRQQSKSGSPDEEFADMFLGSVSTDGQMI